MAQSPGPESPRPPSLMDERSPAPQTADQEPARGLRPLHPLSTPSLPAAYWHSFSSTLTVLPLPLPEFATARSAFPSPFKSPIATE